MTACLRLRIRSWLLVVALVWSLPFLLSSLAGKETQSLFEVQPTPRTLSPLMVRELRGCFDFFWEEWNKDPQSPTYGMTNGDYVGMNKYSPLAIEEQGFYFAAIIIGVEREWITREEGKARILLTLQTLSKLKRIRGFGTSSSIRIPAREAGGIQKMSN